MSSFSSASLSFFSEKPDRDPRYRRDGDEADHQRRQIGPDIGHRVIRLAAADRAAIEMPVTEPSVMRIRLGGIVSVCAPVAASSAARSPRSAPRFSISGNSAGAIAAMSAAFEPEIPDTRYIAATST